MNNVVKVLNSFIESYKELDKIEKEVCNITETYIKLFRDYGEYQEFVSAYNHGVLEVCDDGRVTFTYDYGYPDYEQDYLEVPYNFFLNPEEESVKIKKMLKETYKPL